MRTLLVLFLAIIVISGLSVWAHAAYVRHGSSINLTIPSLPIVKTNGTLTSDTGSADITGTALMDTTSGSPAVPFIKYFDAKRGEVTKQLIFADSRGCLPNAGDIPCVPSYSSQSAYPKLSTGEKIRVVGYIREDRFLVTSLSVL